MSVVFCGKAGANRDANDRRETAYGVLRDWQDALVTCGEVAARDIDFVAPAMLPACFSWEDPAA